MLFVRENIQGGKKHHFSPYAEEGAKAHLMTENTQPRRQNTKSHDFAYLVANLIVKNIV